MPGATWLPREVKVRPGAYVRIVNAGASPLTSTRQGIVGALFRATWGPMGLGPAIETLEEAKLVYGTGGTVEVVNQALTGQAQKVIPYRLGTGGVVATRTLQDTTGAPVNVVRIDAKYVGIRGNDLKLTIRDSLTDPANTRELLVYEGSTLVQTIPFATGAGQAQKLVDAVAAQGSDFITATHLAVGNGTMAIITSQALAGGVDPTVVGGDYSTGLTALEPEAVDFNFLTADTEDNTVQTTIAAWVNRVRDSGKRVIAIVGQPTSVAFATRIANAAAFNTPGMGLVINGFKLADATVLEGYKAAARLAGMFAGTDYVDSLAQTVVSGASEVHGSLSNDDIVRALNSGALLFTRNGAGQVQLEDDRTTLVTLSGQLDAGWKSFRRVRTRDLLMDRIVLAVQPLVARVNNDATGRSLVAAAMQRVLDAMVREGGLLPGASAIVDPTNAPAGDTAYFVVAVDDQESAKKLLLQFNLRFSPPAV